MDRIKYGVLHCHTCNSLKDSVMSVNTLIKRAKELGAPAIAITDHGSMTGYTAFYNECNAEKIKPIIGVEAYIEEQAEGRSHLILMAKDYQGFQALIKAVSESNSKERLVKIDTLSFSRMNRDILTKYFGPGSNGHDHVIATSACVSGVLGFLLQKNLKIDKVREKYTTKQKDYVSPNSNSYRINYENLQKKKEQQRLLSLKIIELKKKTKRSLLSLERKMLNAPEKSVKRQEAQEAFYAAEKERTQAAQELFIIQNEKGKVDSELNILRPIVAQTSKSIQNWEKIQKDIDDLSKDFIPIENIDEELRLEALWYQNTFGSENFYIELQNHGMPEERNIMLRLARLSDEIGIPVCLANDVHIPDKSEDAILARAIIRTTMFDKWENPKSSDRELYIKTDRELIDAVSIIIPQKKVIEGYENIKKIVDACNLELPNEKHYPKFVVPDGSTPEIYLRKLTMERVSKRFSPEEFSFDYRKRMEYELSTIISMGYADYHCIVEECVRYARAAGKLYLEDPDEQKIALTFDIDAIEAYTQNRVGECVGPGRGSAAGSLVCYILGITNIDPLKYGLLFERFLNPERVSMPDIDVDIESTVRPYVIKFVKHKYGADAVSGIINRGTQAGKAALKTAARVYGIKKMNDSVAFIDTANKIIKTALNLCGEKLDINEIQDKLYKEFSQNKHATEIIHYACLIEGCCTQIGLHAGGIIITDGAPVNDYTPLIYNTKNDIMAIQCDMTEAEGIGLLKIDLLGLKNLTIITEAQREIYNSTGTFIDMNQIPFEKSVFLNIYSEAMTNSIFQFASIGMMNMLRNFRPDNIFDLILLVAMYRPGPIQYISDVVKVKNGKKQIKYSIPQLAPILNSTYGSIVFQEQVQEIFRHLAGYSLGQADLVRRAMAKKKEELLEAERRAFLYGDPVRGIIGCVANGIAEDKAIMLFAEVTDFAKYAFNKSHAASYAVLSYQSAYLKYHFPKQYMKSVLNHRKFEEVPGLVNELHKMRIELMTPDINQSVLGFSLNEGRIQFGLGNIKGLKESPAGVIEERKAAGPYQSIQDFVFRTRPSKSMLLSFIDSGAFDSFCKNRVAIKEEMPGIFKILKKIQKNEQKIKEGKETQSVAKFRQKLKEAKSDLMNLQFDEDICEDVLDRLKKEKALLNTFVSGHPLDLYPSPVKCGSISIRDALHGEKRFISLIGIISDFVIKHRKADGAEMGFFTLSDQTGGIPVCCFTKAYSKYKDLLKDDEVVNITGNIMLDQEDEHTIKVSIDSVRLIAPLKNTIIIYMKDIDDWMSNVVNTVKPYVSKNGNPAIVYDLFTDEFRSCDFLLSPAILKDNKIRTSIKTISTG